MPFEEDKPPFIYTGIIQGKFAVRAKNDDLNENIVERTNAEDKKVREYHYRSLKNVLLAEIKVVTHATYGTSWEFYLIDGNQYICWKQSTKGAIGSDFLKMVEGIKLDEPFTIVPGWDKEKERSQVFVFQGTKVNEEGKTVPKYLKSNYTKPEEGQESPCPMGIKSVGLGGEVTWDFTAQNKFLWEKVVQPIRPFLPGVNRDMQQAAQTQSTTLPPNVDTNTGEVNEPEILPPSQEPPRQQGLSNSSDDEIEDLPF